MMIELCSANPDMQPIALKEARSVVPACYATIFRWCTEGIRGRKLQTVKIGGRRYTSVAAIKQFVETDQIAVEPQQNSADGRAAREELRRRFGV